MRKTFATFGLAIGSLLLSGLPAWAQEAGYNPPVTVSPEVVTNVGGEGAAQGGGGAGALAFTGAEIGLLILAAAILAGIGALALIAARRRATRTAEAN